MASSTKDILVYVPGLPTNMSENDLEQMIQTRIETTQRMKLIDVKCYSKLSIAVIRLTNEDDKKHLVSTVESIVLIKDTGINISFADEIDLDSYIVIDRNIPKMPSTDEVARRYAQVYKTQKFTVCESVSVQYPNIFRIMLNTLDDLVKAADAPDLKIENSLAVVYPRADCSFFEDLPSNTNVEKLSLAVATQIGESPLPPTSFYIQYNKQASNAVIVASKSVQKWIKQGHLTIDGQNISKKAKLAYRVIVKPVPSGFDINRIFRNKLFLDRVISYKHINDSLIIEVASLENYQHCLEIGALRIDDQVMEIKPHMTVNDPDNSELDAVNWYETGMLDIKPDITTMINNHQHPIFRYKWNANNWNEQMKKAESTDRTSKKYDLQRHLLRVTVMLNTIGVLRRGKYIVDDQEVVLKCERLKTIGYDHQSKLFYGKKINEKELKTPYKSTNVKIVNEDCLVLYEKLVNDGYRPVLLNMANATSPGGGYRKGDGAQEENVFRRSNYYQSLDLELADRDQSEKLICTSKCDTKRKTGYQGYYPMDEFGAIYTSGITVFRQTEANGYAYMKNPLHNVCAIAMAAYRDPQLNNKNMLENKPAMNTLRKIENIFAVAYHQKHDCLVLSALGCGAFKNPPEHVALLFKSVIYQYAGYFKSIYFAIIDDHNTGNRINPHGNFLPFQKKLDGLIVEPPKTLRVSGVSGPYRILDKSSSDGQLSLSDGCISYLPPCQHGSKCRDLKDAQHTKSFLHPPVCSLQSMTSPCDQINDEVHTFTFIHNSKCKYGGECTDKDAKHLSEYDHPEECKEGNHCRNTNPDHLFNYRHLPVCRDGIQCPKYLKSDPDHCNSYRHCRSVCPYDNCCVDFHDNTHVENTIHSFRKPCPFTPYNCSMYVSFIQGSQKKENFREIEKHCLTYSHVCPYGRYCKTTDERHYETLIHIARQPCPDLNKCSKLHQEDHLESYSHEGIRDIRLLCREPGYKCQERFTGDHLRKFRHGKNHNHLSVAPSSNLNSTVNFVQNQRRLIRNVNNYIEASGWKKAKISEDILNWIRALQPVHRCGKVIFESILVHGHVMSRHYMKLLEKPRRVARAVLQHSRVRLIFLKHNNPAVRNSAFDLIKALVEAEFAKTGADGITALNPDHETAINIAKNILNVSLNDEEMKVIYEWTMKIAKASIILINDPSGIGYDVDKIMGTDKHVFSIIGPHHGFYYGDIVITFKQEIMFHPDANFSIQAATSFNTGKTYGHRPWLKDSGDPNKRVEDFYGSKLHCSVPRYEYAAATELIALTGKDRKSMDVDVNDVLQRWITVDSHEVFEGHLPQLIPLDYIDNVYIPKNLFDSLSPEAQQSAKGAFKKSLIITDHVIDLSLIKPKSTIPLDSTRKPYLQFIVDKIKQKIEERMKTPRISRGIVITVPGSKFEEHIVLPMTISQSYDLHRLDQPHLPNNPELSYIYWQVMHGDMMLTISNDLIEPGKDQSNLRCLVCYVAEKPSTATQDYHEAYSYLNDGHPFRHYTNVHEAKFKAKSNVFYRGCNTDDFFTFCLKLDYKKNEVTLSHAGSNGIYNHQKITYEFNKSNLDLSRIDYIHVSGGNQDVPIRNLTINHEVVPELHPTSDKNFKINTSNLLGMRRASADNIPRAHYQGGPPNNNNANSEQPRERSSSVQPKAPAEKPSLFRRVINKIFGPSPDDKPPSADSVDHQQKSDRTRDESPSNYRPGRESPRHHRPRAESPRSNQARAKQRSPSPPTMPSSKLPPCRDSVYCLNQADKDHTSKYSHLCRFNELCRNKGAEPHLIHQIHNAPKCSDDKECSKLTDPIHRAKYRHTGLPDYLIPCHHQDTCYDKNPDHRRRFFHGEELPGISKNKTLAGAHGRGASSTHLIPCRYGSDCRSMRNPQHTAQYSHPTS